MPSLAKTVVIIFIRCRPTDFCCSFFGNLSNCTCTELRQRGWKEITNLRNGVNRIWMQGPSVERLPSYHRATTSQSDNKNSSSKMSILPSYIWAYWGNPAALSQVRASNASISVKHKDRVKQWRHINNVQNRNQITSVAIKKCHIIYI